MGTVCGKQGNNTPMSAKLKDEEEHEELQRQSKSAEAGESRSNETTTMSPPSSTSEETSAQKLYSNILLTAKNSLSHLEQFGDEFVEKTFHTSFHSHHMTWIDMRYGWFVPYEKVKEVLT